MTCKDCIHEEICDMPIITDGRKNASNCGKFKDKADFVEVNRAVIGAIQLAQDEIREYRKRNGLDPVWEFSPERLRQVAQTARRYMTEGENDD